VRTLGSTVLGTLPTASGRYTNCVFTRPTCRGRDMTVTEQQPGQQPLLCHRALEVGLLDKKLDVSARAGTGPHACMCSLETPLAVCWINKRSIFLFFTN
jgi:hypothetical protein